MRRSTHVAYAGALARHHDDPFDRVVVAQARLEGATLVTSAPRLAAYDVHTLAA